MRKHALLRRGAVRHQQIGVTHGQHASPYADRGAGKESIGSGLHRVRQLHATNCIVLRGRQHARFCIGLPRLVRSFGQHHAIAFLTGLFRVDQTVEWGILVVSNPFAGIEDLRKRFRAMVGIAWPRGQCSRVQPVVQKKINGRTHQACIALSWGPSSITS